jgi:hypothetical protein
MRYKNNVLEKLDKTDGLIKRINLQVSRGMNQGEILESIETLMESIDDIRSTISIEPDDFEQQFAPK